MESPAVEGLGKAGFLARALVVFLIAGICVQVLRGGGGRPADTRGALQALAATPAGVVLLVVLAVAFAGHAAWRFAEAAGGLHHDGGERRTLKRIGFACVGALYVALCVTAVRILLARDPGSENETSRKATSDLLGLPGGRVLTFLLGAAIVGVAAGVAVWAVRGGFLRALHLERLDSRGREVVRWLGIAGQSSRAFVIAVAGLLFVDAAVQNDSSRAQGLDGTLRTIAGRPYGSALLLATCAGLVVYGVYSTVEAFLLRTSRDDAGARLRA